MCTKDILEIIYWVISLGILFATVYYIANGPKNAAENAVRIGRELNKKQQKDNTKMNLFLTLFALRGSPSHYDFVKGLNQIDIVFEDNPIVRGAWHKHYNDLHNEALVDEENVWKIGRVEILSQMAQSLGYGSLKASDILENYYPKGHQYQEKAYYEFQEAHLAYLKSGAALHDLLIQERRTPPPKDDSEKV